MKRNEVGNRDLSKTIAPLVVFELTAFRWKKGQSMKLLMQKVMMLVLANIEFEKKNIFLVLLACQDSEAKKKMMIGFKGTPPIKKLLIETFSWEVKQVVLNKK